MLVVAVKTLRSKKPDQTDRLIMLMEQHKEDGNDLKNEIVGLRRDINKLMLHLVDRLPKGAGGGG